MEEDAMFQENVSTKKIYALENWLSKNDSKWDIFYLGYCNWPFLCSFLVNKDIVKLHSTLLAHAFILNRRGMEKILNYTEYGKINMNCHFDKLIGTKVKSLQLYGAFPMIAFQNKNPALFQKALDKLNIQMNIKTLCRLNEIISLAIPFIIIVLIVYFVFKFYHQS